MELIGIDVGFSTDRPSSGVARLDSGGRLRLAHTTSRWEDLVQITGSHPVDVAAIDAPLTTAAKSEPRACERLFSFGAFQRRCKPGHSNVPGTGQQLRAAGSATARQLLQIAPHRLLKTNFPRVNRSNVVEAFPNAFLGVCIEACDYEGMPGLRRGGKFDWLYGQWVAKGRFRTLLKQLGLRLSELQGECERNTQHDERAALVCLLTAAAVSSGKYTAVGDAHGGYFFLPPLRSWADWARREIDRQRPRLSTLQVWIDGNVAPLSLSEPSAILRRLE